MSSISSGSRPAREIIRGKESQVLSVVPAEVYMVRFTDGEGQVDVCLALRFGTEDDGLPGIVVVEPAKLAELLAHPLSYIKQGIRQRLAAASSTVEAVTGDLDIGG